MRTRLTQNRSPLIAALAVAVIALAACGGSDAPQLPVSTVVPIGPQTEDQAIQVVRNFLAEINFEGEFNCLAVMEAGEASWSATMPDETQFAVTLRADPPALQFRVHTWAVFTRDGRVDSTRTPC